MILRIQVLTVFLVLAQVSCKHHPDSGSAVADHSGADRNVRGGAAQVEALTLVSASGRLMTLTKDKIVNITTVLPATSNNPKEVRLESMLPAPMDHLRFVNPSSSGLSCFCSNFSLVDADGHQLSGKYTIEFQLGTFEVNSIRSATTAGQGGQGGGHAGQPIVQFNPQSTSKKGKLFVSTQAARIGYLAESAVTHKQTVVDSASKIQEVRVFTSHSDSALQRLTFYNPRWANQRCECYFFDVVYGDGSRGRNYLIEFDANSQEVISISTNS